MIFIFLGYEKKYLTKNKMYLLKYHKIDYGETYWSIFTHAKLFQ